MALDLLSGNAQLKRKLAPALAEDRLSHAYILSGTDEEGRRTLARLLAAAMECTEGEKRPCCACPQCRKALSDTHPDVLWVDDPEHKSVTVRVVREARDALYVKPNEGRRKVYVFPRAADMGPAGQNALLKALEEPPSYGAFLLLVDNAEKLLETIRSRCVELQLAPPSQQDELLPQTRAFAAAYGARDDLAMLELLVPLERAKRDKLQPILRQWLSLLTEALAARSGAGSPSQEAAAICRSRSGAELFSAVGHLQDALNQLQANVAPGAICGALQVYLK